MIDTAAGSAMGRIVEHIIDPVLLVVFACGFLLFVYGLVEFLWNLNSGKDTESGKQHMVWGIVGMVIMVSVYGIIALIDDTLDLDISNPDVGRINSISLPPNLFGN